MNSIPQADCNSSVKVDATASVAEKDSVIRTQRLAPPTQDSERWPGAVRVHTLGRFEIGGVGLRHGGKAPQRPLDLLQALIAHGGRAPVAWLADALWPQTEGDHANDAFEVALRRLRKLLGHGDELASVDTVVFAGQWSRVVSLPMPAVGQTAAVELRATLGSPRSDGGWCVSPGRVPSFTFELQAAPAGLADIASTTDGLFGGQSTDVTVRLSQAATSDTRVAITSSLAASVLSGVPPELLIPTGRTAAGFTVTAAANVTAVHSGTFSARLDGNTRAASLHVLPEAASLQLALMPAQASVGQPVTLQVQVTPDYPIPMPVSLIADRPALPVPPVLAIGANAGVATATLSVAPVAQPEVVTVTARLRGLSTSQSMTVSPTQLPPGGAAWQALSPARLAASSAGDIPSVLALDANGRAYISYLLTVGEQQRIIVQREGTTFAMLGTALNGISNWSATSQDMAVAANAQPVLAYGIDSQAIAVAQWNDDERQWDSLIARANLGPADGSSPQLAMSGGVANQQTIVLAWVENERIAVRRYSMATRTWDAGALLPGIDRVRTIRMMLHASGAPVIAYWTGSLHVVREDATGAWVPLGGAINSQPTDHNGVASFGVHVDSGGTVHVAWVEGISSSGGTPWAISASRFDGSSWVPAAQNSSLVFDAGASNVRRFPSALVVARRPDVFAFATSWDVFGSDLSELHVTKLSNQGQWSVNQVPIGQDGQYRSARHVSLAMRDAEHPVITSSHYDASAGLSYVLLGRRFVP